MRFIASFVVLILCDDNIELYSTSENNSAPADCNFSISAGLVGKFTQEKTAVGSNIAYLKFNIFNAISYPGYPMRHKNVTLKQTYVQPFQQNKNCPAL